MRAQSLLLERSLRPPMPWSKLVLALVAFVLLNAIFQYVAIRFGYKRYFLNVELLLAVLAYSLKYRWLGLILFLASIALEIVLGLTGVFHFMDVREAMDLMEFALHARPEYLLGFGALLVLSLASFWMTGRYVGQLRSSNAVLMMSFTVVGLSYCQWAISEESGNFFTPVLSDRNSLVFGSSAYILKDSLDLNRVKQAVFGDPDIDYHPVQHPSASSLALGEHPSSQRILFVISEAWGLPRNPKVLEAQIQALRKSPNVQSLDVKGVYARGATAAGEMRELCALIPSRMNFGKLTAELVGECLPLKLKKQGYKTVSVHGADSAMYRRSRWYPVLGFERMLFKDDMPEGREDCFSFPGYCDENLFSVVLDQLKQDKVFVYWLTLNSHVPYDRRDVTQYRENICDEAFGGAQSEMLCNYQNLHVQFFEGLAALVKDEALKGVEVVVVGDHPPIFLDDENRGRFERDQVPMMHFTVQ